MDPEKLAHSRTLMFLFMNTLFAGLLLVKAGGGGADEAAFSVVVVVGGGGGELVVVGGEVSTRTGSVASGSMTKRTLEATPNFCFNCETETRTSRSSDELTSFVWIESTETAIVCLFVFQGCAHGG